MEDMPIDIPSVIRQESAKQNINFVNLASKSGISYDSILRKVKHGQRELMTDELKAIANALNVPASELVRRAEEAAKRKQQEREARTQQ